MVISFGPIPLSNASQININPSVIANVRPLLSGLVSIQTTSTVVFKTAFDCLVDGNVLGLAVGQIPPEITNIQTLIGGLYTLTINNNIYTNCAITKFSYDELGPCVWAYHVEFAQDTA